MVLLNKLFKFTLKIIILKSQMSNTIRKYLMVRNPPRYDNNSLIKKP